ncbi:39S ribosomal protein L1, mitochondrial-like isoform X2 [Pomacea canaliculata]|uniref:39S ribosomal protein L1, mitochondrial-like isoform X2 n=1 Tax=Pomacea canaliculata TaxID=400727 RepID=UPI000D725605|nr:39S ribosomal protein L1, mitochondrial-like isoform X2 [Pomacea canaliculata]
MATCTGFRSLMIAVHRLQSLELCKVLSPVVIQVRNISQRKTRYKAPHVAKDTSKWTKALKQKEVVVKDPRRTNSPVWLSRVPVDDVWIRSYYPQIKLSIEESIIRHKEYADPTMLDNLEGFIYADMELDMKTTKKTKFLSNIKGTVLLPHQFEQTLNQKIAIFCKKAEDLEMAKKLGANFFGCEDLVKQISTGMISKEDIDVALCTPDALTDLISIRSILRDKFPVKGKGNLSSNIEEMWNLYTKGVTYISTKESEAVGKLQVPLGQLKMPVEQLKENFLAYVDSICEGRSKALGPFITKVFIVAPPSTEKFLLKVEDYVPGHTKAAAEQAAEEESSDSDDEETAARKKRK